MQTKDAKPKAKKVTEAHTTHVTRQRKAKANSTQNMPKQQKDEATETRMRRKPVRGEHRMGRRKHNQGVSTNKTQQRRRHATPGQRSLWCSKEVKCLYICNLSLRVWSLQPSLAGTGLVAEALLFRPDVGAKGNEGFYEAGTGT